MPRYKKDWWVKAKQFEEKLISLEEVKQMLLRCRDWQERVCLLLLYYTGARPSELVLLRVENVRRFRNKVIVQIPTKKGGISRTIFLPLNELTKEIIDHLNRNPSEPLIPRIKNPWNIRDMVYRVSENKYTAYFFRHNRIAKLANKGYDIYTLKHFKGAKTISSVEPYIILAGQDLRKLAKDLD